jgi:hypothetical protein
VGVGGTGVGGTGVGVSVGGTGVGGSVGGTGVGVSVGGTSVGVSMDGTGVGVDGRGVGDGDSLTGVGDAGCLTEIGISVVASCIATLKTRSPTKQANKAATMHPPPPMTNHHLFSIRGLFLIENIREPFASTTRSFNCYAMALTTSILSYHRAKIKNRLLPRNFPSKGMR